MKKYLLMIPALALLLSLPVEMMAQRRAASNVKKDLTLQLYSLRDDISKDYEATITKVGKMGFASVEAAGYADGKFYGKSPSQFKADIAKAGMTVLSSHTNRALTEDEYASKDFKEALKWWDKCISAHKEAGASFIVDPWMSTPKSLEDLKTYCDYLNEVGKKCKDRGIMFGYHNHAHEFEKLEDVVIYDFMMENTNPEYVFFQMDVYWVVRGQNSPVDYLNKYPGRYALLHFKDNKELGQSGMVGFDAILKNTDVAGVRGLVVEVEKYSFDPFVSVQKSLEYLLESPLVKANYNNINVQKGRRK